MNQKFLFNIGHIPKQTALMSTITNSRGQYVVSIIEANIDKVLIGSKPVNKHIKNARKTLILMIDSLPELFVNNTFISLQAVVLGLKTCVFCFMFVWFRATLPRLRYDQLIEFCWLNLLPVAVAFIILVPCILVAFDIAPY